VGEPAVYRYGPPRLYIRLSPTECRFLRNLLLLVFVVSRSVIRWSLVFSGETVARADVISAKSAELPSNGEA
jgi:hypothetical protein